MATTSYLYHALGLKGYVHQRTDYRGGGVFHHVELAPHKRLNLEAAAASSTCEPSWMMSAFGIVQRLLGVGWDLVKGGFEVRMEKRLDNLKGEKDED